MTILFLKLQITRSDIRPHIKWAVSLVFAYGQFNFPQGFMWVLSSALKPGAHFFENNKITGVFTMLKLCVSKERLAYSHYMQC